MMSPIPIPLIKYSITRKEIKLWDIRFNTMIIPEMQIRKSGTGVGELCCQEMLPRGRSSQQIRWIDSEPCANEDEARIKIEHLDKGWYDCIAVKYYDAYNIPETEKIKVLRAANTQAYCKYNELASAFHFTNAKAEYIGCKNCGSKIARKYLRRNFALFAMLICAQKQRSTALLLLKQRQIRVRILLRQN